MPAKILSYYGYDEEAPLECPRGWRGRVGEGSREYYAELFDVSCPECDAMLLIVGYPTIDETKAEAARGTPRAIRDLPQVEQIEAFQRRFDAERLKSANELPELEGDALEFLWDFDATNGHSHTILRVGTHEVWREPALWDGADRFFEIKQLLKERYGDRFRSLTPTEPSKLYLYGDRLMPTVPVN